MEEQLEPTRVPLPSFASPSASLLTSLPPISHIYQDMPRRAPPPRPLPRLPWDVVLAVMRESDPASLAAFAGTCFEVLEMVAPVLYQGEVVIKSSESLRRMFCETKGPGSPRIDPLLSLSQVTTLTLDFGDAQALPKLLTRSFSLSPSRLPNFEPLPLEVLNLTLRYDRINILSSFHRSLFPLLNPRRFNSNIIHRPLRDSSVFGMGLLPVIVEWDRTELVDLKGVVPSSRSRGDNHVVGLPLPVVEVRRVVRLHLNSLLGDQHRTLSALATTLGTTIFWILNGVGMQEKTIVLVVAEEEEKAQVQKVVATLNAERWRVFEIVIE